MGGEPSRTARRPDPRTHPTPQLPTGYRAGTSRWKNYTLGIGIDYAGHNILIVVRDRHHLKIYGPNQASNTTSPSTPPAATNPAAYHPAAVAKCVSNDPREVSAMSRDSTLR